MAQEGDACEDEATLKHAETRGHVSSDQAVPAPPPLTSLPRPHAHRNLGVLAARLIRLPVQARHAQRGHILHAGRRRALGALALRRRRAIHRQAGAIRPVGSPLTSIPSRPVAPTPQHLVGVEVCADQPPAAAPRRQLLVEAGLWLVGLGQVPQVGAARRGENKGGAEGGSSGGLSSGMRGMEVHGASL